MRTLATPLLAVLVSCACTPDPTPSISALSVESVMSGAADPRFARALEPRELSFPRDHGSQPQFQTEWWYFTSNLVDASGREFGCQLTFFRRALGYETPDATSSWNARDVYMAHFTLTDVATGSFHAFERFERGALGLAGAESEPQWRVWNRDWSSSGSLALGEKAKLSAHEAGFGVELELEALTAPVLNGERGYSRKGAGEGAASYYYSLPRMRARGCIVLDGRTIEVEGRTWFDREWSTSALDPEQIGWDWFALRLGAAGELMMYSMRRRDGARDPHCSGTWTAPDGSHTSLGPDEFEIEPLARWTSPRSNVSYPSRWRVRVPGRALELEVEPLIEGQELDASIRYWEGAVRVRGKVGALAVDERGYVELAGY